MATVPAPRRWLLLGAAVLPPLAYLAAELYLLGGELGFPLDDSWIHLVFARHLAAGEGLAFRSGELVTGSTAPLWTALLAFGFLLPGSPLAWAKAMGVLWHVLAIDATRRLAGELVPAGWAWAAALLTALTSWLVWISLAAMEVPFFTTLSLWGMLLHVRERRDPARPPLALAVLALSVLARPEGTLLLALAVADRVVVAARRESALALTAPDWRALARGLALAAVVLVPTLVFYGVVGGSPLPTTYSTKASYAPPGMPDLRYLWVVGGIFFQAQPAAVLLSGAGALALVGRLGTGRDRGLLPALWALGLPLAYGVLSAHQSGPLVGNFGRYFFPLFPVVVVLGVTGAEALVRRVPPVLQLARLRLRWAVWVGAAVLLPSLAVLVVAAGRYAQSVVNVHDSDVAMARWLAGRLPPEAVVAVNDIGAVGWFLPNEILDLAGIATPEVHRWARAAVEETGDYRVGLFRFVEDRRPDYLLVFPAWFPGIDEMGGFRAVSRLQIRDNITMGGDELVLYATPWTRHPLRQEIP